MIKYFVLLAMFFFISYSAKSQNGKGAFFEKVVLEEGGDTVLLGLIKTVYVYAPMPSYIRKQREQRNALRKNIYYVYPYVLDVAKNIYTLDSAIAKVADKKTIKQLKNLKEKELMRKYKPIVTDMTYSQGKLIVLLLNRETGKDCFEIIKELKGGFNATFWQGVALLFENNLKRKYDPQNKDQYIESVVQQIKANIPY